MPKLSEFLSDKVPEDLKNTEVDKVIVIYRQTGVLDDQMTPNAGILTMGGTSLDELKAVLFSQLLGLGVIGGIG